MSGEQPPVGRGGRGALLLAALQNQPRRPGETSGEPSARVLPTPPSRVEKTEGPQAPPPIPVGRGALLQTLLQGRGCSATVFPSEDKPVTLGRGLGRGLLTIGRGRASLTEVPHVSDTPPQRVSPPSIREPSVSVESLTEELEEVTIGKYSGTAGRPLPMEVNYVRLKISKGHGIYEYHVNFAPAVDSRNMRFKLMAQPQVKEVTGNVKSFDGAKLYLPVKLPGETRITANLPTDNSQVCITIKYTKEARNNDMIHLYNLLFKKIMSVLKMTQIGRNYFNPKGGIPIPQHRLEVWPGYITAVQDYEGGIMLNCDASFRVLRTVTARDIMQQCASNAERMQVEIEKRLVGTVVLTRYNNKTYRVDDIKFDMTPRSKFRMSDGKEVSFCEYYKNCYDITISDLNQPLLINRPKKKVNETEEKLLCLIPELCFMTGLTDAMRSDFKVMRDIASHTRVTPSRRQYSLRQFIENVNSCPDAKKILANWNLEFDDAAVSFDGRALDSEKIFFKKGNCLAGPKADWSRDICQSEVLVPVDIQNWLLVCTSRDAKNAHEFVRMLQRVSPSMGIRVNEPVFREIRNDKTETYCNELRDYVNPSVQLAVIIFPTARDDRYSAIKKLCCVDMPVPSQVINARTISQFQKLRSVTQKIALQINCKLGGELWSLAIPMENVMVCGLDVYHDSVHKKNSILGFVASINRNLTRWFSMTNTQRAGQEIGDSLRILFISALRKYHEINHKLPQKVFIYRDGVSDGMLDTVANYEVQQLIACFSNVQQGYNPSLSVVVVQKRINTRMFARMRNNLENPPPGSILDHTVTRKRYYDFFLISQHVGQGTVSPTHYIVAHDSSNLKVDHMQKLTYKMTHLYYNWPGTIRVPAPCQYAHRLAFLVGQNLHKEAHADLADKLFYL